MWHEGQRQHECSVQPLAKHNMNVALYSALGAHWVGGHGRVVKG